MAAVIFAFGSAPNPAYLLMTFVRGVVGRDAPATPGPPVARLVLALLAFGLGAVGARRVTLGATGWPRSLPVAAATARRAAWAAACFSALPVACFAAAALALARWLYQVPLDPPKVVGFPLLLAAAGATALRVERGAGGRVPARALSAAALVAAAWGTWPVLVVAAAALAGWDRWAGGLAEPRAARRVGRPTAADASSARRPPRPHHRLRPALLPRAAALALAVRWAWRAAGVRVWADGLLAAVPPVAFAAAARANNPDLAPGTRAWVARLGAHLGVLAWVACGAGALLARRAPWPWARALSWSAAARVLVDAVALGAPAVLLGAVAYGALTAADPARAIGSGMGAAAASAAVAALAAAAALRVGAGRQTGAVGELALTAAPAAVAFALRPTLAWAAPLVALALGALAVRRDRRAAGAVRWNELRHDVVGDVGWITRA